MLLYKKIQVLKYKIIQNVEFVMFRDDDCIATKNKSNPFDNRTKKGGEMRLSRHEKTHFQTNTPGRAISRTNHTCRSKTPNRYGS